MDRYSTHLSLLMKVVAATTGPVLELGVGAGSTPALHRECAEKDRLVVSYDTDAKYLKLAADRFAGYFHEFHLVERDDWGSAQIDRSWSVVLIDHRPAWRRRIDALRLAPYAEYIVIHDTEPEIDRFYRFSRIWSKFKFRYDDEQIPRTSIVSNLNSLDWLKGANNGEPTIRDEG